MESGTLGTQGNVQVILPKLTECYSDSVDPPEATIPVCTLKFFPKQIEHTLQWGRDKYEELFFNGPFDTQEYCEKKTYLDSLHKASEGEKVQKLSIIYDNLVENKPNTFEDCVIWARKKFETWFHNDILQLLYKYPLDAKDKYGLPLWSAAMKPPTPAIFSLDDPLHLDFVVSCANLRAQTFGLTSVPNRDLDFFKKVLRKCLLPSFTPSDSEHISLTEEEEKEKNQNQTAFQEKVKFYQAQLPKPETVQIKANPIPFEKDDDTNFHLGRSALFKSCFDLCFNFFKTNIDFVCATSNLRAINYSIPPVDRSKSKVIAGKITPAIATTTSYVAGATCLEFYKILLKGLKSHEKKNSLEISRDLWSNSAISYYDLSESKPARKLKYFGKEYTIWDRFEVEDGSLSDFLNYFKKNHKFVVTSISVPATGRSIFLNVPKPSAQRLNTTVSDLVSSVGKFDCSGRSQVWLIIAAEKTVKLKNPTSEKKTKTMESSELPQVCLKLTIDHLTKKQKEEMH